MRSPHRRLHPRFAPVMCLLCLGIPAAQAKMTTPAAMQLAAEPAPKAVVASPIPATRVADVQRLLQQGKQHLENSQNQSALQAFQQALTIAQQLGDRRFQGWALRGIGDSYLGLYDVDQATPPIQQALDMAREQQNRELESAVLNSLGRRSTSLKDDAKALEYQQQAIAPARAVQNRELETEILRDLGRTYNSLSDYPAEIEAYQQRLAIARSIKNRRTEGQALLQLGQVYDNLTDYPKALDYAQQALTIAKEVGDRNLEADSLTSLGGVYYTFKNTQKAIEFYQQSLAIATTANYQFGQFAATTNLGLVHHFLIKDYVKTSAFYQQALAIAQTENNQANISTIWFKISGLYKLLNQQQQQIAAYEQGIKTDLADRHLRCASQDIYAMGRAYAYLNQSPKALEYYQQALTMEQTANQPKCQLEILLSLGDTQNALQDHTKVLATFQQALLLARSLPDQTREFNILAYGFGRTFYNQKDYQKAIAYYQQALDLARTTKHRYRQSLMLSRIGDVYMDDLKDYPQAIAFYQQAIAVDLELKHRGFEIADRTSLGNAYNLNNQSPQAIEAYQQAQTIAQTTQNRDQEINTLNRIGSAYRDGKNYPQAIEYYQKALGLANEVNDLYMQTNILINMGDIHSLAKAETKAISAYQQALMMANATKDEDFVLRKLINLGGKYGEKLGNWPQSIALNQQALIIARKRHDRRQEGWATGLIGVGYNYVGNLPKGMEFLQKALVIAQEVQDLNQESLYLANLSANYLQQGDAEQALTTGQQALAITRGEVSRSGITIRDRDTEGLALIIVGAAYLIGRNDHRTARDLLQQGLIIAKETRVRYLESFALAYLALVDADLSDYPNAIKLGNQALTIAQDIKNPGAELLALSSLAVIYQSLGDYATTTAHHQKILALTRKSGNQIMTGITLLQMGQLASSQGNARQHMELIQQAAMTFEVSKSPKLEAIAQLSLADGYSNLKDYPNAIAKGQSGLKLAQLVNDRSLEYGAIKGLGHFYRKSGQDELAIATYQAALAADPTPELPGSGAGIRVGLARIYQRQKLPMVAIAYYKQAVSGIEEVRHKIQGLPPQLQQFFIQKGQKGERIADYYRELADLLLTQGRVLEAEEVLDLLKVQELKEFRQERNTGKTPELTFSATEAQILKENGTLIAFGRQVQTCEQNQCPQLNQLRDQRKALTSAYNQTLTSLEKLMGDRRNRDPNFFDPNKTGKINAIVNAQPHTVMISPLVLNDKLWLIWASPGGVVKSVEVPVSLQDLSTTVAQFRQAMRPNAPVAEIQKPSKQLYDWLIKPLESELKTNKVENLVFALDRVTRYIPMSALFDGQHYLIENYTVSTILSADLTDTQERLPRDRQSSSVLALGAANFTGFNALPNVPNELNAIVRNSPSDTDGIYSGKKYLNNAFDEYALQNLSGHNILHIASHAEFVSGRPKDSYIVLGTSKKLNIPELKDLLGDLNAVQLVVLSACNTGLGGETDGIEISGISSYFLNAGAKTVIASLWSVNDSSTSQLMQQFYQNLAQATPTQPITKSQALRQAQLSMLRSTKTTTLTVRGDSFKFPNIDGAQAPIAQNLNHPYFWAPFILIGNSL